MLSEVIVLRGRYGHLSRAIREAVSDVFFNAIKAKSSEILNSAVEDYMNDFVIPLHAECLRDEKEAAVAKVCVLIKQAAHQGIHGVIETKEPDEKSPSKIHFETAVKDLQVRYEKTIKMEKLHAIEMNWLRRVASCAGTVTNLIEKPTHLVSRLL